MKQNTPEWYAARKHRVTGSVAGAILGKSPFQTRDDIMRKMVLEYHGIEEEINQFLRDVVFAYGRNNEGQAKFEYEMQSGNTVIDCGFYAHEHWLGASPDGLIEPFPASGGILEIKCPYSKRDSGNFDSVYDMPHYYAQAQVEMYCAGAEWCDFFQWSSHGSERDRVHISEKWLDKYLPELRAFYEEYLVERENLNKYTSNEIDTPTAAKMLAEYDELAESIDLAKERQADIFTKLKVLAGGESAIICGRKFTKVERAGSVSYAKALKELAPGADLTKWTGKPSEYWKLT